MKISPKDIEQFIVNVPKNIRAILLYGPDHGLIKLRVSELEKSRNLAGKFNYEQIKNNPSLFLDSLNSLSLFGENLGQEKIVSIECTGTTITENLSSVLKAVNYQGLVIFYAEELGPDSSLRRFFEANSNIASIPCYVDDQVVLTRVIGQVFKERQITCEAGLITLLLNYISVGDRGLVLSEIEKILLFLGEKKHIVIADLKDFLALQGEVSFDKLCYQISLRQVIGIEDLYNKLEHEGHNLVSIVRMVIRHFTRLYQVKHLVEQGKIEQQALDSLSPPLFFKQVNDFSHSIKLWTEAQLVDFLKNLNQIELAAKQTSMPADLMFKALLLQLVER